MVLKKKQQPSIVNYNHDDEVSFPIEDIDGIRRLLL
jgi:hypothetical protein